MAGVIASINKIGKESILMQLRVVKAEYDDRHDVVHFLIVYFLIESKQSADKQ